MEEAKRRIEGSMSAPSEPAPIHAAIQWSAFIFLLSPLTSLSLLLLPPSTHPPTSLFASRG
jgi:hypothetical protein